MADQDEQLKNMLDFLNAPEDEVVIGMDCSDCDQLAAIAERVAAGTPVAAVLPALNEHLVYWKDCREEFEALVAVLKAENDASVSDALDQISAVLDDDITNEDA
jgi:hypothetical protein